MSELANKKQSFFGKNKVFFITAGLFLIYYFGFVMPGGYWKINVTSVTVLLPDYKTFGFVSKVLPGAIYNLLVGRQDTTSMSIYGISLAVIMILLVCAVIQKFWNAVEPYKMRTKVLFTLFLTTGVCTFYWFISFYAYSDMHWMLFFLIAYFLSENRVLRWITPLFFAAMIAVHTASVFCAVPLLGLIFLLRAAAAENKYDRISFAVIFVLATLVSVGSLGYFSIFDTQNIKFSSYEEMQNWFAERDAISTDIFTWSFFPNDLAESYRSSIDYNFPEWYFNDTGSVIGNFGLTIIRRVWQSIHTTNYEGKLPSVCFAVPVMIINWIVLGWYTKSSKNKLKKFLGFCFITLSALNLVVMILFSNDILRWAAHSLFVMFGGIMAISKYDDNSIFGKFEQILDKFGRFETIVYAGIYALGIM